MENQSIKNEDFQFFNFFVKYIRHWPLFVLSIVICCGFAFLYLEISQKVYLRKAVVMIQEDQKATDLSAAFSNNNYQFKTNLNVKNEIEAFKSLYLTQEVVARLKLNISYVMRDRKSTRLNSSH